MTTLPAVPHPGPGHSGPDPTSCGPAAQPPDDASGPTGYWYGADKQALLGRLRRIEGQVRGLHRMVEQDTYCIDILTQISATTRALQAVALGLLDGHLAHCVLAAAHTPDAEGKLREASDAIARLVRS